MSLPQHLSDPASETLAHEGVDLWIITYQGHPVRFVQNTRKVWSVVHIDQATEFATREEAEIKLLEWSLLGNSKFAIRRRALK